MSTQTSAALFDQDAVRQAVDATLTHYMSGQTRNAHHRGLPQQSLQALSNFLKLRRQTHPPRAVCGRMAGR